MSIKKEITQDSKIESSEFKLELPERLQVEPWAVIALPRKQQAMIYEVDVLEKGEKGSNVTVNVKRYDVYVVSQKSLKATSLNSYRNGAANYSTLHMHELKHYLHDVTAYLNVRRKTRTTSIVDEDNSDDE